MTSDALSRLIVPGTDSDVVDAYAALADRAQDAVFGFEDEVVFVDIETTGFDIERDGIIEIAGCVARGPEVVDRFHTMVDPGIGIPPEITKLTGIAAEDIEGAPGAEAAVLRFAEFAGGRDIIAHNVSFDRGFLVAAGGKARFPGNWIDSLQLALIALPRLRSHRLYDLACAFGACEPTHRATDDVEALTYLWRIMLCALDAMPDGLLGRLAALAPEAEWPLRPVIAHIGSASQPASFDMKQARKNRTTADRSEPLVDAEDIECRCPPVEQIVGEFAADGIAGRMYPGFEPRQEQARMAEAVLDAFRDGRHLAVEAGTGVGKSVAYLVPAARFALDNQVSVGVATKTNSLMDQLVYSELPALCAALDEPIRYVALKGYDHYPCLRKLDRYAADLGAAEETSIATVAALMAWVAQSSWGDLDATNIHWRPAVRGNIQASVADCTHKRCRYFPHLCYVHGVRRRASSAHIVVTNHALLFRDVVASGGILPPVRHWIVDEAHAIESEARKQLTLDASHLELAVVLSALHSRTRGGLLDNVRRRLAGNDEPAAAALLEEVRRAEEAATLAATLNDSLFDFAKDIGDSVPESGYERCELRITPELRDSGAWGTIASVGNSLLKKLESLLDAGRSIMSDLEELGAEFTDQRADLTGLLSRLVDQQLALATVLDGEADEFVYAVTLDRRRSVDAERLTALRLDVGGVLAEEFFPGNRSVICTSATMAAGDDFSHFARTTGLDRVPEESWSSLRLESSYEFERQMAVFVPTDVPDPGTPGYLDGLGRLLEGVHRAMGGSTLTLFTNRREMDSLYRSLAPLLERDGVSLVVQGRGASAKRLRDEFIADEALSLFATKSFWEGFDAKGDTLRCVVVPKLPFGRPDQPLAEERQSREGWAAWKRYSLPEAIIELKQAAGRLIRSKTDTGCLVIGDARVLHKTYGREFLATLPVSDIEVMTSAEVVEQIATRFGRSS